MENKKNYNTMKKEFFELEKQNKEIKDKKEIEMMLKINAIQELKNSSIIKEFKDEYYFLNNDFECESEIVVNCIKFKSVTQAFVYHKSDNQDTKDLIINSKSIDVIKKINRMLDKDKNWYEKEGIIIMEKLVRDKFRRNKDLQKLLEKTNGNLLLNTLDKDVSVNNFYSDEIKINKEENIDNYLTDEILTFGIVNITEINKKYNYLKTNSNAKEFNNVTKGENQLGIILTKIRSDIQNNVEINLWVETNFSLIKDIDKMPDVLFNVYEDKIKTNTFSLKKKKLYFIGSHSKSDILINHVSVSRNHAVILFDLNYGLVIIDLGSKKKTIINDVILEDHKPYVISSNMYNLQKGEKCFIRFGDCLKDFEILYSHKSLNIKIDTIKNEIENRKMCLEFINQIKDNKILIKEKGSNYEEEFNNKVLISILEGKYNLIKYKLSKCISICIDGLYKTNEFIDFLVENFGKINKLEIVSNFNSKRLIVLFESNDSISKLLDIKNNNLNYKEKNYKFELVELKDMEKYFQVRNNINNDYFERPTKNNFKYDKNEKNDNVYINSSDNFNENHNYNRKEKKNLDFRKYKESKNEEYTSRNIIKKTSRSNSLSRSTYKSRSRSGSI